MTLNEIYSKFNGAYALMTYQDLEPVKIFVFKNEYDAEEWIKIKYSKNKDEIDDRDYDLVMVIQSDFILDVTLNERWSNATVEQFYVVGVDTLVVVVTPYEDKKEDKE